MSLAANKIMYSVQINNPYFQKYDVNYDYESVENTGFGIAIREYFFK